MQPPRTTSPLLALSRRPGPGSPIINGTIPGRPCRVAVETSTGENANPSTARPAKRAARRLPSKTQASRHPTNTSSAMPVRIRMGPPQIIQSTKPAMKRHTLTNPRPSLIRNCLYRISSRNCMFSAGQQAPSASRRKHEHRQLATVSSWLVPTWPSRDCYAMAFGGIIPPPAHRKSRARSLSRPWSPCTRRRHRFHRS